MRQSRPRILILEALPTIAGGQRVLLDLLPALHKEFDVTVVIPDPGPLADALHALHIATATLPIQRYSLVKKTFKDLLAFALSTPRLALALRALVKRTQADLVYANSGPTFPWGTLGAVLAGCPVVWYSHNNLGDGKSLLLARLLARSPAVRRIIGTSPGAVQQFRQPGKSVVVRSGVDLGLFKPMPEQRQRMRGGLDVDDAIPLIGLFGDFIPLKRQDVFLKAAQRVRQQCPDARFVVVGNERTNPESRAYRRALGPLIQQVDALVLPWPDDLATFLNALDITVVASTTETGPLILFQSMACGVPVVSTPVGHAPDLLVSGETGELFAIDDDHALSQALLKLIQDPSERATLRQNILLRARQQLDIRRTRERVVEVLKEQLRAA